MKSPVYFILLLLFINISSDLFSQSTKVTKANKKTWVENIDFDSLVVPPAGQEGAYYYLLLDEQENTTKQEYFRHYAYKILTNEGVQEMSDLSFDFDPTYEQLIFHSILIHRNGKAIDQLHTEIRTIQREESMDRFLYDNSQTAIINLTDVRAGDIVEYSLTKKGYNPIYDGHINRKIYLNNTYAFEKGYQKIITSANSKKLSLKTVNTDVKPEIKKEGDNISYAWRSSRVPALLSDTHEPDWYNPYHYVFITDFTDWSEVATWALENFQITKRDEEIIARAALSKFKHAMTPEKFAMQAIRFVQDEIRYLGFESGLNSHKPHAPIKVYNQRFGDCKDKSFLLVTILRAKGIEAHPVLVNTNYRDKISEQLPSAKTFDHCVVMLKINDLTLYVDPTINDQGGNLTSNYFPAYGKGLIIKAGTTDLVDLPKPALSSISETQTFNMDSLGGAAIFKVKTIYAGAEADNQRSYFARNNLEATQKSYLNYYGNLYPDIEKVELIKVTDDRDSNIYIVEESYKISKIWKQIDGQVNTLYCDFYPQSLESYFSVSKSAQRTAPYHLTHPLTYFHEIHVNAPDDWNINTDDMTIDNPYYHYDFKVNYKQKHLSVLTQYKTKESFIPVEAFAKFVEDHGKMMANLNYRVSYDQKSIMANSFKWPGIALSILSLGLALWLVFWLYHRYNPQPYYPAAWGKPIGGWLALVAIIISITPLMFLISFFKNPDLLSGEAWLRMLSAENYAISIFLVLEHAYNIVSMVFAVLVVVLFFQRRSSTPTIITLFYGVSCILTILDAILCQQIDPHTVIDTKEIIRSLLFAAVLIPYFNKSNRVKRTFVNTYSNKYDQENTASDTVVMKASSRSEITVN